MRAAPCLRWLAGFALATALSSVGGPARAWGTLGHEQVASHVPALLPGDASALAPFGPALVRHCMDAARRKSNTAFPEERFRHYLMLDAYPWPDRGRVPADRAVWIRRHGAARVRGHGLLPWAIAQTQRELVKAFRARDSNRVAAAWADLCHYLTDASEPLHVTLNNDGQRTGQSGLHARLEAGMLIRYRDHLHLPVVAGRGRRGLRTDAFDEGCRLMRESLSLVPRVLAADRLASAEGVGTAAYYARLWHELGTLAEARLAAAAEASARCGYAAWVEAGRPDVAPPGMAERR